MGQRGGGKLLQMWECRPTNPGWRGKPKKHQLPTVISDPQDGVMQGSQRKLNPSGLKLGGAVKERRNPADTPSPP